MSKKIKVVWVARSFLDYRLAVYAAVRQYSDLDLWVVFSELHNSDVLKHQLKDLLGDHAIGLSGEKCIGKPYSLEDRSNTRRRVFYQPGLYALLNKMNPDVIITEAFNHWTLPVFLLKTHKKFVHILCYERTAHTERNIHFLKRLFISHISSLIDAVQCNGILCKQFLQSLGYAEQKLRLGNMAAASDGLRKAIPAIPENEIQRIRTDMGMEKWVYLYVGGLIPRKGVNYLLKAWHEAHLPDASLVLVGGGSEEKNLRSMVVEDKIKNVIFAGRQEYEKLPIFYRVSNCFVIPTLEDNWSLVVPEAMACNLPVVCSKYNGCYPELITPDNGWIFDPLDAEDFRKTLVNVHERREELQTMGRISNRIEAAYSPQKIAEAIHLTAIDFIDRKRYE